MSTMISQGAIFVFPVLYVTCYEPWSSHSVINVLAPFDSYVKIPSRGFLLLRFHFVYSCSTRSRGYYAPFYPHSVYVTAVLLNLSTFAAH
jgi:hypothetical protein